MDTILTANENLIVVRCRNYRGWIEKEAARRNAVYPNWHLDKSLPPYFAFVEHSTWVWQCPDCEHLWWAEPGFPRAWCPNCLNVGSAGFSRLVLFPKERGKIERALKYRAEPKTRNWLPHETVDDLIAENIQHGV